MLNLNLLKTALQNAKGKQSNSSCDASQVAIDFFQAIPEEIRPYFNNPRGVQLDNGQYLGSVVQIAGGSLKRLQGPPLELLTASLLNLLLEMDERDEASRELNPSIIQYKGQAVKWDVRRYSSSQNKAGAWQSIPDYSVYFDTTHIEMRDALSKQKESQKETNNSTTDLGGVTV